MALSVVFGFAYMLKVLIAKGAKPEAEKKQTKDLKTLLEQVTEQLE